jgi:16S rRNA (cytosine967-C5)-methyltransferase
LRFDCIGMRIREGCAAMRMHRILAEAAAEVIRAVFDGRRVLDRVLAEAFERHPKWGKRDRSFVAETAFEVVRWRRALEFVADGAEAESLCAAQWRRMGFDLPDWWRFHGVSPEEMAAREDALTNQPPAVRESIPDWLDRLGEAELGEAWSGEIAALNRRARVCLRVNTLRTTRDDAVRWLAGNGVETGTVEGVPECLVLAAGKSLPKHLLTDGRVEIQDAASQTVAPLLDAKPGETVIDACCGAGGKTLQLAARMENRGTILALDVDSRKLDELKRRAARAGVRCVRTRLIGEETIASLRGSADRLLIDAPCSGLGTLRRQPDLKWRLQPESFAPIWHLQRRLLSGYPAMLKPGGALVYATCSILPSENREAVNLSLKSDEFDLLGDHSISPSAFGFDGFHAVVMRKR